MFKTFECSNFVFYEMVALSHRSNPLESAWRFRERVNIYKQRPTAVHCNTNVDMIEIL
jgi:hypothetical protein